MELKTLKQLYISIFLIGWFSILYGTILNFEISTGSILAIIGLIVSLLSLCLNQMITKMKDKANKEQIEQIKYDNNELQNYVREIDDRNPDYADI